MCCILQRSRCNVSNPSRRTAYDNLQTEPHDFFALRNEFCVKETKCWIGKGARRVDNQRLDVKLPAVLL